MASPLPSRAPSGVPARHRNRQPPHAIDLREDASVTTPYYQQPPRADILNQVLATLQSLSDQVGQMRETMATRADLERLVPLDVYQSEQRAAADRIADHAARMTAVESKVDTLREKLHAAELADVRGQVGTQRQLGTGLRQVSERGSDLMIRLQTAALTSLGGAVLWLLLYALQHPR